MFCPFLAGECRKECALRVISSTGASACALAHLSTKGDSVYAVCNTEVVKAKNDPLVVEEDLLPKRIERPSKRNAEKAPDGPAILQEYVTDHEWVKNPRMLRMNGYVTVGDLQCASPSALRHLCAYTDEDLQALKENLEKNGVSVTWSIESKE